MNITIPLPAFLLLVVLACILVGGAGVVGVSSTLRARAARERAERARTKRVGSPVWFFKTHRFFATIAGREVPLTAVRFRYGIEPCVELVRGVAAGRRSLAAIVEEAMGPNGLAVSLHVHDGTVGDPAASTRVVKVQARRARATLADLDTHTDEVWTERVVLHGVTITDDDGRELDADLQRKIVEAYDPKAPLEVAASFPLDRAVEIARAEARANG